MWRVYTLVGSWIFYNWGITANFRHCGIRVTDFLLEEGLRGLLLPLDLWKTSKRFIFIIIKQHEFKKMLWFAMICLYLETAIPHILSYWPYVYSRSSLFSIFNFPKYPKAMYWNVHNMIVLLNDFLKGVTFRNAELKIQLIEDHYFS